LFYLPLGFKGLNCDVSNGFTNTALLFPHNLVTVNRMQVFPGWQVFILKSCGYVAESLDKKEIQQNLSIHIY
jgi:hypothetical protein